MNSLYNMWVKIYPLENWIIYKVWIIKWIMKRIAQIRWILDFIVIWSWWNLWSKASNSIDREIDSIRLDKLSAERIGHGFDSPLFLAVLRNRKTLIETEIFTHNSHASVSAYLFMCAVDMVIWNLLYACGDGAWVCMQLMSFSRRCLSRNCA